jgi:hypothetical protein
VVAAVETTYPAVALVTEVLVEVRLVEPPLELELLDKEIMVALLVVAEVLVVVAALARQDFSQIVILVPLVALDLFRLLQALLFNMLVAAVGLVMIRLVN